MSKAIAYVVIEHTADGKVVTEHASKCAAHAYGMELRRAGKTAFAHSVEFARAHRLI